MWQNGYLPEDQYLAERDMPLLSVQNGDFESFKASLPRGIILPMKSAVSLAVILARMSFSAVA